jgi:hypothetical protein
MKVYNKGYMNNNFIDENLFIKKAKAIAINYLGFENMLKYSYCSGKAILPQISIGKSTVGFFIIFSPLSN